jgi:hypothetical protein
MDIRIRRLTFDDAAILHRVAVDVFDEPVNAKRIAAYLAEPGHLMIAFVRPVEQRQSRS